MRKMICWWIPTTFSIGGRILSANEYIGLVMLGIKLSHTCLSLVLWRLIAIAKLKKYKLLGG
jgi:hypothetical protein